MTLKSMRRLVLDAVMRNSSSTEASNGKVSTMPHMTLDSGLMGLGCSSSRCAAVSAALACEAS
jgi:hypothetical protein